MADTTFAASEAIMFAEWILKNRIRPEVDSTTTKWVSKNVNDKILGYYGEATSLQLYQLYLKSKV